MDRFLYGEEQLTVGKALQISRKELRGFIGKEAAENVLRCQQYVEEIVDRQHIVYGINTGFGPLCTTIISKEETEQLQSNILQSHSVGVGDPISEEMTRLMMILKVHSLAKGYSGIRLSTLKRIIWLLENDLVPVVPSQGSVGASGDLAPLAHLFLPLIGHGKVHFEGKKVRASHPEWLSAGPFCDKAM